MLFDLILQELPNWKELNEVLLWLIAGGSAVAANAFLAFLAENFAFWHTLNKNVKLITSLVVSVLIGLGAYYLMSLPEVITIIEPYWTLVVTMLLAWFASQTAYLKAKNSGYAAKTYTEAKKK